MTSFFEKNQSKNVHLNNEEKEQNLPLNAKLFLLESKALGSYQIQTYCSDLNLTQSAYPIIYILDGKRYFSALIEHLNIGIFQGRLEHCILVAIDYPAESHRDRDYLPMPDQDLTLEAHLDPAFQRQFNYGGADAFLKWIEIKLRPFIEQLYPVDKNQQTLFGHSYGGLFTLYTLFTQPNLFQSYFASSPSIWFSGQDILHKLERFKQNTIQSIQQETRCEITVGELEQSLHFKETNLSENKKKWLQTHRKARKMVTAAKKVATELIEIETTHFKCDFHIYAKKTHHSAPFMALSDLLAFSLKKIS